MRTPTTVFGATTTTRGCALGAQALDQVVHLGGVAARVDAVRDVPDDALLVDDESGTHQALAPCAALVLLLLQHAVLAAHLALGVGEERDGNAVTVAEIGVRQAIVARDAEHHAVVLNKLLFVVGEISRDQGAAGRAVARIEVEHHVLLALERRQRDGLHVGVGQLEGRCGLSRLQHRERFYAKTFFKLQQPAPPRAVVSSLHIIVAVNSFLLGGLTPREFLRRHWQKKPLFVRGALPRFAGMLDERQLRALAARDAVEARVVERHGRRYQTVHGPFKSVRPKHRDWTLLVSGVNLHHADADRLLRRFSFVPQARLDDVMVSYATPGGGVGPHVDSYDVFLLQGSGRRRWRIGARTTWVASAGDLVYLPPGVRHDGVALEPCTTYSIGFRAPRGAELGAAFLDWLHERGLPEARYRDPGLRPAPHNARIPPEMVAFAARVLRRIRWTRADVAAFLGEYLSMPKPHVVFEPARRPRRGTIVRLDPKSQLLYRGARFFINGDALSVPARAAAALRAFADERSAATAALARAGLGRLISDWQRRGYVRVEAS